MTAITQSSEHLLPSTSLADDLNALYQTTRTSIGEADLNHIRHVAAYANAIKKRSRELLMQGEQPDAFKRGVSLYMLHVLLEFSELGHNIMHGCYDHLPNVGEFHSERWQWDFVADPIDWKTMHHGNHHPFTNVVGKDHDLGYSLVRVQGGQDWKLHHLLQMALVIPAVMGNLYPVALYAAVSAAWTEERAIKPSIFKRGLERGRQHFIKNYLQEPLAAGSRFLPTLFGNYAGTTLGYTLTLLILGLEHHATNVQLFADPDNNESQDDYYRRQVLSTTNFTPIAELDAHFQGILAEEVDFPNPPAFEVFYGGLETHIEHHLFPDLPCNRQRDIAPEVRAICQKHGLPYNVIHFGEFTRHLLPRLAKMSLPIGEREINNPWSLLKKPKSLIRRLIYGAQYKRLPERAYLALPGKLNVSAKVLSRQAEAGGIAHSFKVAIPKGWEDITWDAGAFISVSVTVGEETLVRQYSLTTDSQSAQALEFTTKRVKDGRVSNYLNNYLQVGDFITLVSPPVSSGDFILTNIPQKSVFIAGGVGITPILSMLRKIKRDAPQTDTVLVYFNRDPESIIYLHDLEALRRRTGISIYYVCDDNKGNHTRFIQDRLSLALLQRLVPDAAERIAYVCAPAGMIEMTREFLTTLGMPEANFHTENFAPPTLLRPTDGADHHYRVYFKRSNIDIQINGNMTLLEAARSVGIKVPTGCERGLCKACSTGKCRGTTQLDEQAHTFLHKITICNSLPRSDIELDI